MAGESLQAELRGLKAANPLTDYGWYPHESLSSIGLLSELMTPVWEEVREAAGRAGVADIGCADGDAAALFARLGCVVDAIDHRESNFNQMRGIQRLSGLLGLEISIHDVNLDAGCILPRPNYGLALLLGTLYHLKNPFSVLEKLAEVSDWVVLSTRIAQVTPRGTRLEEEPVAYLLGPREANNDPTNFWIFSGTGIERLMERAGWSVVNRQRIGCREGSDPVRSEADERIFLLARSRTRDPGLYVRPVGGWYPVENDEWRWTAKRFALEVTLPTEGAREFALRFNVPEILLQASPAVQLTCRANGMAAGSLTCTEAETIEFRGRFPEGMGSSVVLEFEVTSSLTPTAHDSRDLGVIIPLPGGGARWPQRIPFRVS